jgi:acyl-CoA synthetase (AMP-forming)/AMP-acid ligase II
MERFAFSRLRHVLFAGEVLPVRHLRDLMGRVPHARFWNLYGPTETNVCTYHPVSALGPADTPPVPIGRACAHAQVFAVSEGGRLAEPGEVGELFVGGPSLMRGYWGRPEASAEVLVPDPRRSGGAPPVYRTGDLVRLDPDGTYSFLGRRDLMVKSRGYRVELGEIEAILHGHPDVREAAVVAIPDERLGHRLHAMVVPREGGGVVAQDIQAHCAAHLPRYMVPERVEVCERLPRTSSGKVDRRALSAQLAGVTGTADAAERPGGPSAP